MAYIFTPTIRTVFNNLLENHLMQKTSSSSATLRIWGDDLFPDEVTKLLNCEPTSSQKKAQIFSSKKSGKQRAAKTGLWRLGTKYCEPANLDFQILEIFEQLPDELNIWQQLSTHYDLDIFCALFLETTNDVVVVAPEPMQILSSRGVALELDIYTERNK